MKYVENIALSEIVYSLLSESKVKVICVIKNFLCLFETNTITKISKTFLLIK